MNVPADRVDAGTVLAAVRELVAETKAPVFAAVVDRYERRAIPVLAELAAAPDAIPDRAGAFGGHHYLPVRVPLDWDRARAFCENHGAHLAAITGEKEQAWIAKTFPLEENAALWIGGSDRKKEAQWRWVTGEEWRYENWGDTQPDDDEGGEDALGLRWDGTWNDARGVRRQGFLMEWDR